MNKGRRTPAERAIIYAALIGGLTIEQAKELLLQAGFGGRIPYTSWEMLTRVYLPEFLKDPAFMGQSIYTPLPMGRLSGTKKKAAAKSKAKVTKETGVVRGARMVKKKRK